MIGAFLGLEIVLILACGFVLLGVISIAIVAREWMVTGRVPWERKLQSTPAMAFATLSFIIIRLSAGEPLKVLFL
jgi:hypothetical protein